MHADATSIRLENEVCFENEGEAWGNKRILYYKKIKKPRLCSFLL